MGEIVVVTGAESPTGRLVVRAALAEPGVDRVVAVVPAGAPPPIAPVGPDPVAELSVASLAVDDPRLVALVRGATALVHLGPRRGPDLDGTGGEVDLLATRALLSALARVAKVRSVVVLSSALVYGARDDNPVPLTEEAGVRPNPAVGGAVELAELEHVISAWSAERGASCAVLRPCVVVGPENGRWLARSPWSTAGLQVSGAAAPVQFVHVEDLATAAWAAQRSGTSGPVNVAPDGWLTADQVRALKGPTLRIRVRRSFAPALAGLGSLLGLAPGDPAALLASSSPWVVANDRLRALGWEPGFSNEEAYVDADRGSPWAMLTPRHRQEIALGAVGTVALGLAAAVALLVRRRLRNGSSG